MATVAQMIEQAVYQLKGRSQTPSVHITEVECVFYWVNETCGTNQGFDDHLHRKTIKSWFIYHLRCAT